MHFNSLIYTCEFLSVYLNFNNNNEILIFIIHALIANKNITFYKCFTKRILNKEITKCFFLTRNRNHK